MLQRITEHFPDFFLGENTRKIGLNGSDRGAFEACSNESRLTVPACNFARRGSINRKGSEIRCSIASHVNCFSRRANIFILLGWKSREKGSCPNKSQPFALRYFLIFLFLSINPKRIKKRVGKRRWGGDLKNSRHNLDQNPGTRGMVNKS